MIKFVTGNKSKFVEVTTFLQQRDPSIQLEHVNLDLFEIQTRDHRSIALHKAQEAWRQIEQPLLIDDSGIYLEKYGTFPGTLTKYVFQGIGYRGFFRLVDSGDRAVFLTTLVYVDREGNPHLFEGKQEGEIVKPERLEINNDFPIDQIFVPLGTGQTYSEMFESDPVKFNRYNYRIMALEKFTTWYATNRNS